MTSVPPDAACPNAAKRAARRTKSTPDTRAGILSYLTVTTNLVEVKINIESSLILSALHVIPRHAPVEGATPPPPA